MTGRLSLVATPPTLFWHDHYLLQNYISFP